MILKEPIILNSKVKSSLLELMTAQFKPARYPRKEF
jgi:hypothetical protein